MESTPKFEIDEYVIADFGEIWYEGTVLRAAVERVLNGDRGITYMVKTMDLRSFGSIAWLREEKLEKVGRKDQRTVEFTIGNQAMTVAKLDDKTRSPLRFNDAVKKLLDNRTNRYRAPHFIAMEVLYMLELTPAFLGYAGGFGGHTSETHVVRTAAKQLRKAIEGVMK